MSTSLWPLKVGSLTLSKFLKLLIAAAQPGPSQRVGESPAGFRPELPAIHSREGAEAERGSGCEAAALREVNAPFLPKTPSSLRSQLPQIPMEKFTFLPKRTF